MDREEKDIKELNSRSKYTIATILLIVMIVILGLVTLVTMIYFRNRVREDMNLTKNEEGDPERYYALVVRDNEDPYWESAYESMKKQGELYNVYVDRAGKNLSVDYSKYDLMEMAISSGVDGIIYEADDSEESLELINKAVAAGIPVVTVRADAPASARRSFVGVSFYNLGTEYGRLITEAGREAVKLKPSDKRDTVSVLVLTDGSILTSENAFQTYLPKEISSEEAMEQMRSMSLYELSEYIYRMLCLSKLEGQTPYATAFFDGLKKYMEENIATIEEFLDYWDSELHHHAADAFLQLEYGNPTYRDALVHYQRAAVLRPSFHPC